MADNLAGRTRISLPFRHRIGVAARALAGIVMPEMGQGIVANLFPSGGSPPPRASADLIRCYNELPWCRSVVNRISTSVSNTEFFLELGRKNGEPVKVPRLQRSLNHTVRRRYSKQLERKGEIERIDEHPLLSLFIRANPLMSGNALLKLAQIYLEITGEAFLLKQRSEFSVDGKSGMPLALWPIPPNWIQEVPRPGHPYFRLNSRTDNAPPIPMTEIVWFRELNPQDPYGRGVGVAKAVDDEFETDEYAAQHVKSFFFNRARPDLLIYGKGLQPNDVERVRKQWLEKHQGFFRQFLPHFMTGDISVHEFSQDFNSMQFAELRKWERDLCQQVWNVPPEVLGIISNPLRAGIDGADYLFNKQVIDPRQTLMRNEIQVQLVPDFDERLSLEYESTIPADAEAARAVATAAPWSRSFDEWRELGGLEPLEKNAGKFFMMPFGLTPTPPEEVGVPVADPFATSDDGFEDEDDAQDDDVDTVEEEKQTKARFVDADPGDESYRLVHAAADKFFGPMWHAFFDVVEDRKDAIDMAALEHAMAQGSSSRAFGLTGVDLLTQATRNALTPLFAKTFEAGGKTEARHLQSLLSGKSAYGETKAGEEVTLQALFNITNPRAIQAVRTSVANLIVQVTAAQKDAVREIIELSFIDGLPPSRSAQLIREVVGLTSNQAKAVANFEMKLWQSVSSTTEIERRVAKYAAAQLRQRSMTIARTETINAASAGQQELWKQAVEQGLLSKDQKRKWIVTPDDRLDAIVCEPMNGQEVGLNEPFITGDNRKVMNPTAHPKCRCSQRLVIKK